MRDDKAFHEALSVERAAWHELLSHLVLAGAVKSLDVTAAPVAFNRATSPGERVLSRLREWGDARVQLALRTHGIEFKPKAVAPGPRKYIIDSILVTPLKPGPTLTGKPFPFTHSADHRWHAENADGTRAFGGTGTFMFKAWPETPLGESDDLERQARAALMAYLVPANEPATVNEYDEEDG